MRTTNHGTEISEISCKLHFSEKLAAFLLVGSIVLTTMTSLRVFTSFFGIGEFFIVLFFLVEAANMLRHKVIIDGWTRKMILYHISFTVCFCICFFVALLQDNKVVAMAQLRVIMALGLAGLLMFLIAIESRSFFFYFFKRLVWIVPVVFFVLLCMRQIFQIEALGMLLLQNVELSGGRFTGGALNPNQLALLMAPFPLFIIYYGTLEQRSFRTFVKCSLLFIMALSVLFATQSDIGIGSVMIAFLVYPLVALVIPNTKWKKRYFRELIVAMILGVALLLILVLFFIQTGELDLLGVIFSSESVYQPGSDNGRIYLWKLGTSIILDNPCFGLAGIPNAVYESEIHNTFLDILVLSGVVGGAVFFAYMVFFIRNMWNSSLLLDCAVVLLLFIMFHFLIRQPFFWITFIVLVKLAQYRDNGNVYQEALYKGLGMPIKFSKCLK